MQLTSVSGGWGAYETVFIARNGDLSSKRTLLERETMPLCLVVRKIPVGLMGHDEIRRNRIWV